MITLIPPGEFGIISSQSQVLRNRMWTYLGQGWQVILPITGALQI